MGFEVRLDFAYGRCTLVMAPAEDAVEVTAYRLHRSFDALVHAVAELAEGTESVSCRWVRGELAGGVFLDFVADPDNHVNLAVHEFAHDESATTHAEIWSAVRSRCSWNARVPRPAFVLGFAAALRRVRVLYTDETDYLEHWGFLFPESDFQRVLRCANRLGYQPMTTAEVRDRS